MTFTDISMVTATLTSKIKSKALPIGKETVGDTTHAVTATPPTSRAYKP